MLSCKCFGKSIRAVPTVFCCNVNSFRIPVLQFKSRERQPPAAYIFMKRHTGDIAEKPVPFVLKRPFVRESLIPAKKR